MPGRRDAAVRAKKTFQEVIDTCVNGVVCCHCPIWSGKGGSQEPLFPDRCSFRTVVRSGPTRVPGQSVLIAGGGEPERAQADQAEGSTSDASQVIDRTMLSTVIARSDQPSPGSSGSTTGVQS